MKIFLRRIPANTSKAHLQSAVERAIAPRWYFPLRRTGVIHSCRLLKIEDLARKAVELHGLVDVRPDQTARSAIMKLNGRKLAGKVVEAREWRERSPGRDRRKASTDASQLPFPERRRRERRRSNIVIEVL
ncbi:MAG: hypothetical protein WCA32_16045 [Chromatiaceae bacterium]